MKRIVTALLAALIGIVAFTQPMRADTINGNDTFAAVCGGGSEGVILYVIGNGSLLDIEFISSGQGCQDFLVHLKKSLTPGYTLTVSSPRLGAVIATYGSAQPAPGALNADQVNQSCPLAPGMSGSVQLFDNMGGDSYYFVLNCGQLVKLVVHTNYTAANNNVLYFTSIGGVLP